MKLFEVGGCVRDEILGVPSKDIDFSVVLDTADPHPGDPGVAEGNPWFKPHDPFPVMVRMLKHQGFKIYVETPEFVTARGKFPRDHDVYPGLDADFVLARKEGEYTDGRRPDKVEVGTLEDDLARRDFTMNAIAKDEEGNYIDPYNGMYDIEYKRIRTVGNPYDRLTEDALRAVRAIRFAVTKGFTIESSLAKALEDEEVLGAIITKISDERIAVEVEKMVRFDTVASIEMFNRFPLLTRAMFSGRVSLDASMKTKGRG